MVLYFRNDIMIKKTVNFHAITVLNKDSFLCLLGHPYGWDNNYRMVFILIIDVAIETERFA